MRFVYDEDVGHLIPVVDEEVIRERVRINGLLDGIQFRQAEQRYDGLPRWRCRDCGKRVWAGRGEARGYVTLFELMWRAQRCATCACASMNDVLEEVKEP